MVNKLNGLMFLHIFLMGEDQVLVNVIFVDFHVVNEFQHEFL